VVAVGFSVSHNEMVWSEERSGKEVRARILGRRIDAI